MKDYGYVIKNVNDGWLDYGDFYSSFSKARIFTTRDEAREDKKWAAMGVGEEVIYKVSLTKNGKPKKILGRVR